MIYMIIPIYRTCVIVCNESTNKIYDFLQNKISVKYITTTC